MSKIWIQQKSERQMLRDNQFVICWAVKLYYDSPKNIQTYKVNKGP